MAEFRLLAATDAAEARGDAAGALELIKRDLERRQGPPFWRPERIARLAQLSVLGRLLPGWATSRWILAQAAQSLDEASRPRMRRAFEIALGTGAHETVAARDDVDRRTKVMDHDWVFRQALLYDLGGLRHFIDRVASADLLAGSDRVDEWATTPMGGFRLVREEPRTVRWLDLGTGEELETVNIGAASLLEPGHCAIGRLVPLESGATFESAPLPVPEPLASRVAADPADWAAAVSAARRTDGGDVLARLIASRDFPLLTDVPTGVRTLVALHVVGCGQASPPHVETASDVRALMVGLVRAALDERLGPGPAGISCGPSVAAALLDPTVLPALWDTLGPADAGKLRRLAGALGGPAADLCRMLAFDAEDVA